MKTIMMMTKMMMKKEKRMLKKKTIFIVYLFILYPFIFNIYFYSRARLKGAFFKHKNKIINPKKKINMKKKGVFWGFLPYFNRVLTVIITVRKLYPI